MQTEVAQPEMRSQFLQCVENVFVLNKNIARGVSALLRLRRPSAVVWRIVAIKINAVKRTPSGTQPHVLKKAREAVPSFANLDPASTVAMELYVPRVAAPLTHSGPRIALPTMAESQAVPATCGTRIRREASTTARFTRNKIVAVDRFHRAALASTHPLNTLHASRSVKDRPASKRHTGAVYEVVGIGHDAYCMVQWLTIEEHRYKTATDVRVCRQLRKETGQSG